jgi:hypothetical protein
MEHDALETLRKRHPAWILLASRNSAMVLSILNRAFVEPNASNIAADDLVRFVDDELYALRERLGDDAYPRSPGAYLDEWADADHGWLRKFYPPGDDQPHYDLTPAVQAALDFVGDLETRSFVGTESRLQTIFELLRQLADDRDADPSHRLAELRRRRDEIDAKIARAEAGYVDVLDSAARRDRYQQFARTARELLADFRQVEENFRLLDRQLRERIAGWDGSKGELLDEMIADRHSIAESDQGRSFRAFYDLLLSAERQVELTELLDRVHDTSDDHNAEITELDPRLARTHFDWIDASERTQRTVRQLSEQLRRFLDDQVWLENRRVFELLRSIEHRAWLLRGESPDIEMSIDDTKVSLSLPFERPLFRPSRTADLDDTTVEEGTSELDLDVLDSHAYVDRVALIDRVHRMLGARRHVRLAEVIDDTPLEQGLAELVGYFSLDDAGFDVVFDDDTRSSVSWDSDEITRVADIPDVSFARHVAEGGEVQSEGEPA